MLVSPNLANISSAKAARPGSISTAYTLLAPALAAIMLNKPDPVPMSHTTLPGTAASIAAL